MKIAGKFYLAMVLMILLVACAPAKVTPKKTNFGDITGSIVQETESGDVFKFGVMMPLTGGGAEYGIPLQNAIELARSLTASMS